MKGILKEDNRCAKIQGKSIVVITICYYEYYKDYTYFYPGSDIPFQRKLCTLPGRFCTLSPAFWQYNKKSPKLILFA